MADQEQGLGVAPEIVLEPQARLQIEMVGRLVQEQQIGLGEQHGGERHPHAPAAGEAGERLLLCLLVEAEAGQDRARPRRRGMGADVGQPGLDLGDGMRLDRGLGGAQQPRALLIGLEHRLARRALAARRLLRDPADPGAAAQPNFAGIRRQLAQDQAQQRGLAAAVGADQAMRWPAGRCTLARSSSSRPPMRRVTSFRCSMAPRHSTGAPLPNAAAAACRRRLKDHDRSVARIDGRDLSVVRSVGASGGHAHAAPGPAGWTTMEPQPPAIPPRAATFYAALEPFTEFAEVADPARYVAAPDDWIVVLGDIKGSTEAARAGRYKEVNLVGAACITATLNVTGDLDLPTRSAATARPC